MPHSLPGFLVVHRNAALHDGTAPQLVDAGRGLLGGEIECVQAGGFFVLRTVGTAIHRQDTRLRLGHGSAAHIVDGSAEYGDWRNAQLGGFATVEIGLAPEALRVSRDRFGAVAVYVRRLGAGVGVSTSREWLAALSPRDGLDEHALLEAVRFRWQSGHRSLDLGISQLAPGEELTWTPDAPSPSRSHWGRLTFRGDGPVDLHEQSHRLKGSLTEAVAAHFGRSSHPGILLSGGVDSSVIAAIAAEVRPDTRCFIARVAGEDGAEEGRRARFVAQRLGLPLIEVPVDTGRFAADLVRVVSMLEEPPRNPNNLILLQLYEAMRHAGIDCVLNGDGAEMLLGLADTERVARFVAKSRAASPVPRPMRDMLARWLRRAEGSAAWRLAAVLDTSRESFAAALDELSYPPSVRRAVRRWMAALPGDRGSPWSHLLEEAAHRADFDDRLHIYQCYTVLLSSQRRHECLARACGIEAATPFTHDAVLRFAADLPRALRYTTRSRPVLKHLCDTLVHPDVANWPKLGFSVPWHEWLDHELAPMVSAARAALAADEALPGVLRDLVHRENDAEWRWTILALHLALGGRNE